MKSMTHASERVEEECGKVVAQNLQQKSDLVELRTELLQKIEDEKNIILAKIKDNNIRITYNAERITDTGKKIE